MIRHGVVGNISACHADARGSIPRDGAFLFLRNKMHYEFAMAPLRRAAEDQRLGGRAVQGASFRY